jgi:hypothetical protein
MAFNFKNVIDTPIWRPHAPLLLVTAAGTCSAWDMRKSAERNAPFTYVLRNATTLYAYNPLNDDWMTLGNPALGGTHGAGSCCVFHPTAGPRGTISAGATGTEFTLSTALLSAVGANQLANSGDGEGYYIRLIDNGSGGSGKTESRQIIANSASTQPTITVAEPFSFTPVAGSTYEIRSGRLFMLCSNAANGWKFYDLATHTFSAGLSVANLPALGTDSTLVALSEGHVPHTSEVGLGFLGAITATASSASTITGSSTPSLFADEYRNFQVRIVEDATTPTAAGQRARIASHTSGTNPVFTLAANWATTPSADATFVVENDDDKILLFNNQTTVYNYNIAANTWTTNTWDAAPAAGGAGIVAAQAFGIERDATGNARHSYITRIRGGNLTTIDVFDIAGNTTGSWSANIEYANRGQLFNVGTSGAYDGIGNGGRYLYLNINGTQRYARYDLRNNVLEPWAFLRYPQSTVSAGGRLSFAYAFDTDGAILPFLYALGHNHVNFFSVACHR